MDPNIKHLNAKLSKLKQLIRLLPDHLCTEDIQTAFKFDDKLLDSHGMAIAFEDCMQSQLEVDDKGDVEIKIFSRNFRDGNLVYLFEHLRDFAKDEIKGCYLVAITWMTRITAAMEKALDVGPDVETEGSDGAPAKLKKSKKKKEKKSKHKRTLSTMEPSSDSEIQEIKEGTADFKRLKAQSLHSSLSSHTASLPPDSSGEDESTLEDGQLSAIPLTPDFYEVARQRLASRPKQKLDKRMASNQPNLPPSQTTVGSFFKILTDPAEVAAQQKRLRDESDAFAEAVREAAEELKERKARKKRNQAAERQRKHRSKDQESEWSSSSGDETTASFENLAAASQSATLARTKRPKIRTRSKRVNYFHPLIFPKIEAALIAHQWENVTAVLRDLRSQDRVFAKFHRKTLSNWIARDENDCMKMLKKFRPWVYESAEAGGKGRCGGRTGVLHDHPKVLQDFKELVEGLRKSGQPVDSSIMRGHLLTLIHLYAPSVLNREDFVCSDRFVRSILADKFGMSYRKWTKAAKKTPVEWESVCTRCAFRITKVARDRAIPPELVVNMDQTGVLFEPGVKYTYEQRGAKQVAVVGKDAKRAYTLCVASSVAGDFLPMQQICSGKTSASCPSLSADGRAEATDIGMDFTFTGKQSHYSTLETMKRYIQNIVVPYRKKQLDAHPEWPQSTPMILLLDCYPVHTGKDFSAFLRSEHPYIILLFIPANCTGLFQPADVGLQRFLKHFICKLCVDRRIAWQIQQVKEKGIPLADVAQSDSIKVLRDATVRAMVELHKFMITNNGRDVVRKAWEKCIAGGYSLASVTSYETRLALEDYLASPEGAQLREEIIEAQRKRIFPPPPSSDELPPVLEAQPSADTVRQPTFEEENICSDMPEDDLAAPSHAIIAHSLGLQISPRVFGNSLSIPDHALGISADPSISGLSSVATTESVYNYDTQGEVYWARSTGNVAPVRPTRKVILRVKEPGTKVMPRNRKPDDDVDASQSD